MVVGHITVTSDVTCEEDILLHLGACVGAIQKEWGQDVDIVIYINKELNTTGPIKTMTQSFSTSEMTLLTSSSLSGTSVQTCFDGGFEVTTPPSGCSLCNIPFSSEVTSRGHQETVSHKRNQLTSMYRKDREIMIKSPHPRGLQVFAADAGSPDPDIGMVDDGVVEVVCQPGQTKSFKLVLKNVLPALEHEDVLQDSGIVVEEVAVLKKSENLKMTDEHNLCTKEFGEGMKIRLKPGKKYKVRVTASAREEAVEEIIPVVVAFEAGGLKQFSAIEIVLKIVPKVVHARLVIL